MSGYYGQSIPPGHKLVPATERQDRSRVVSIDDETLKWLPHYKYTKLPRVGKFIRLLRLMPAEDLDNPVLLGEIFDGEFDPTTHHVTEVKNQTITAKERATEAIRPASPATFVVARRGTDITIENDWVAALMHRRSTVASQRMDGPVDYEALSWCWGTGLRDCAILIRQDGIHYRLPTSQQLTVALKYLRLPKDNRVLWVDAICINQDDDAERNHQVQLMAQIYTFASQVCIWLGEEDDHSAAAIKFIKEEIMKLGDIGHLVSRKNASSWHALLQLMQRPWFSRRWVIQEIALAREAMLYCGQDSMRWQEFAVAVEMFVETETVTSLLSRTAEGEERFYRLPEWFEHVSKLGATLLVQATAKVFRQDRPVVHTGGQTPSPIGTPMTVQGIGRRKLLNLEYLVSSLFTFESTEPRDVIYSMLSIARDAYPVAPSSALAFDPQDLVIQVCSSFFETKPYVVDYGQSYADACKDFVLFCVERGVEHDPSSALDVLCRPWAPDGPKNPVLSTQKEKKMLYKDWELRVRLYERRKDTRDAGSKAQSVTDPRTTREYWDDVRSKQSLSEFLELYGNFLPSKTAHERPVSPSSLFPAPNPNSGDTLALPSWVSRIFNAPFALYRHPGAAVMRMGRKNADYLVGAPQTGRRTYNACQTAGLEIGNMTFHRRACLGASSHYSLYLDGFIFDRIEEVEETSRSGAIPKKWFALGGWSDPEHSEPPAEFWRTLVADRGKDGQNPPYYYTTALKESVRRGGLESGSVDTTALITNERNPIIVEFCRRVQAVIWNRRLVKTKAGRLGMVQEDVRVGDLVCVLFGCSVPVILRRHQKTQKELELEQLEDRMALVKKLVARCEATCMRKMLYQRRKERLPPYEVKIIEKDTKWINETLGRQNGGAASPAPLPEHPKENVDPAEGSKENVDTAEGFKGLSVRKRILQRLPIHHRSNLPPATTTTTQGSAPKNNSYVPGEMDERDVPFTQHLSETKQEDDKMSYYQLLGESYMHGAMDGEAMAFLLRAKIQTTRFELR